MLTNSKYTSLTLFLILALNTKHVVKRSVGDNPLKKVMEKCVGKGCEELGTSIPSKQKNVLTAQDNNAAAQLQVKETSVPTTDIVKPLAPLPQSGTTSQVQDTLPPKFLLFKDHKYALDNAGVKYALQKGSNQNVKDNFDPAQEALKLAHEMGANNTTTDSSVETKELFDSVLQKMVEAGLSRGIPEKDTISQFMDSALLKGDGSRMMALNYVLTHNLEMSDQYYIILKEILQEWNLIKNEQDKDIVAIADDYKELFENLKKYQESKMSVKEGPGLNKNYKEYLQLIQQTKDIEESTLTSKKDFYEFIKTEKKSRCFLEEDFEQQIAQNEQALKTVFDPTTTKTLTEQEVLVLLHRVGVVTYPDASYFVPLNAVNSDGSVAKDNRIEKESEGVKILSKVYKVLVKDNYVCIKGDRLSTTDAKSAINTIEAGQLKVGTIISDPDHQTLIISGKRLHPIVVIQHPRDQDAYLIVGNLTSAREDTLVLSKKQPNLDNNEDNMALSDVPEKDKDKEQRFLLGKSFVKISKAEFKEKVNGTTYLQGNDEQGCSIVRKIIANFLQNKDSICDQPVEALQEFTLEQLLDSAKIFLQRETQQLQEKLNQLVTKLDKMDEKQREQVLKSMERQRNNDLKKDRESECYENLTRKQQVLYNFYNKLLEFREKSKAITKRIKDKILFEENQKNAKKAFKEETPNDFANKTNKTKNKKVNKNNEPNNKDENT